MLCLSPTLTESPYARELLVIMVWLGIDGLVVALPASYSASEKEENDDSSDHNDDKGYNTNANANFRSERQALTRYPPNVSYS